MSLTIKAATAMHFAGAPYAAGDTIDTTGMDDRSIAVLLKHQPVYVSAASGAPTVDCTLTIQTSTDQSSPTDVGVLRQGGTLDLTAVLPFSVPAFAASGYLIPQIHVEALPAGADVYYTYADIAVSNATGTEQLVAWTNNQTDLASLSTVNLAMLNGTFDVAGTDLTLAVTQDEVDTAAGGMLSAMATIRLYWAAP